jgi:hypothetical protein
MPDGPPEPAPRPGILPWLVGLFALWQLAFIPLANVSEFIPRRPLSPDDTPQTNPNQRWGQYTHVEPLQSATEFAGDVFAFWGEASGQDQGWSMFTPGFPPHTLLPVIELRFPDGTTDRIYSRFEPPDLANPRPRAPLVGDRVFNFEVQFTIPGWFCDEKSLAARPEYWSQLPERVRDRERPLTRWLAWQVKQYRAAHPNKPEPIEVVLLHRYIPTPLPREPRGWTHKPPFERPFARWFPTATPEPGYLALEGFDPVAGRWVKLKAGGQP